MFSGQGSQYFQMGRELYDNHARFRMWMDFCDEIVEPLLDCSLMDVIYDQDRTKADPFDNLRYTNPAILAIEYSLSRILQEMDIKPDYLLGYSLGEYTAAVVGGMLTIEEALELVIDYAQLLVDKTPLSGMMAVIDSIDIVNQYPELFSQVWVSGINFDRHFVVSGTAQNVDKLELQLKSKNLMCQQLAVNYGFHTELIDSVEQDFAALAAGLGGGKPNICTYSSLTGAPVDKVNGDYLWQVTRQPVEFYKVIEVLLDKIRQEHNQGATFIDVGPSGTLATFTRYIIKSDANQANDSSCAEVINQFGKNLQSLDKLRQQVVV